MAQVIDLAEAQQFFDQMVDLNIPSRGLPCELEGILESMCMPLDEVRDQMPFCGGYVHDQICVPAYLVSGPAHQLSTRQYFELVPECDLILVFVKQIWSTWDLKAKDFLVEEIVVKYLEQRLI